MPRRDWHSSEHGHHAGPAVTVLDGIDVIACEQCGFKHIVPLPSSETQAEFYQEEFYQSEKDQYLKEADEDFAWKAVECELRFSVASDLLEGQAGRVLDIGSGPGDFLAVGKSLGWDGVGVEPSPVASDYARDRGLDVRSGFFDSGMAETLGQFDFIHMSEVLEHVAQPCELLELAYDRLVPGGVLCVSTPNDYNSLQSIVEKRLQKNPWWIVPDHHLNYYDFDSLSDLIASAGFTVKDKLTNFPMELFLLMGQDYTVAPEKGRELHGWRKALDINLAGGDKRVYRDFYRGLAQAGLGRLAIIFACKPLESGE